MPCGGFSPAVRADAVGVRLVRHGLHSFSDPPLPALIDRRHGAIPSPSHSGEHLPCPIEPFESRSHKLGTTPRWGSPSSVTTSRPGHPAAPHHRGPAPSPRRGSGAKILDPMKPAPAFPPRCHDALSRRVVIVPEQRSASTATDPSHWAGKPARALRPRPPHNPPGRGRDASAPEAAKARPSYEVPERDRLLSRLERDT